MAQPAAMIVGRVPRECRLLAVDGYWMCAYDNYVLEIRKIYTVYAEICGVQIFVGPLNHENLTHENFTTTNNTHIGVARVQK